MNKRSIYVLMPSLALTGLILFAIFNPDNDETQPETVDAVTPAETYKSLVKLKTNGLAANEAVAGFDADNVYQLGELVCSELSSADKAVSAIELEMVDFFRSNGHDAKTSENIANGFISASTQPGGCE